KIELLFGEHAEHLHQRLRLAARLGALVAPPSPLLRRARRHEASSLDSLWFLILCGSLARDRRHALDIEIGILYPKTIGIHNPNFDRSNTKPSAGVQARAGPGIARRSTRERYHADHTLRARRHYPRAGRGCDADTRASTRSRRRDRSRARRAHWPS